MEKSKELVATDTIYNRVYMIRGQHIKKLPYAFTENGHGRKGFLTEAVVKDFMMQFPPLKIKPNPDCHDRFIVIDYGMPTEQAYHCGASSKDAGKKLCAINKLENSYMIHPPMDKLLTQKDKKV